MDLKEGIDNANRLRKTFQNFGTITAKALEPKIMLQHLVLTYNTVLYTALMLAWIPGVTMADEWCDCMPTPWPFFRSYPSFSTPLRNVLCSCLIPQGVLGALWRVGRGKPWVVGCWSLAEESELPKFSEWTKRELFHAMILWSRACVCQPLISQWLEVIVV